MVIKSYGDANQSVTRTVWGPRAVNKIVYVAWSRREQSHGLEGFGMRRREGWSGTAQYCTVPMCAVGSFQVPRELDARIGGLGGNQGDAR